MIIEVAKSDLEAALQVVSNSIASSGSDISTHFLFRAVGDPGARKVEILTYTNRLFACAPLKCVLEDEANPAFTVEGKRLTKWLSAAPDSKLVIRFDGSKVEIETPKGDMDFQSLNPANFPYWDKRLEEVKLTATLPASRLASALAYARQFNGVDLPKKTPELLVSEVQGGRLLSGDRKALVSIKMEDLASSSLRVHYNDGAAIVKFLGTSGDHDVEVLESDHSIVFRRLDGAYIGNGRFQAKFPNGPLPQDTDPDQVTWEVPKDQVRWAINFLHAGADDKDIRVRFSRPDPAGPIKVSMIAMTGREKSVNINLVDESKQPDAPDLPDKGFMLPAPQLLKVISAWQGDNLRFGLNVRGVSGYVKFVEARDGDSYMTLMVWLKEQ